MAKRAAEAESQDIKTQDPALPVKMQFSPERGPKVVKDFDNLEQFIEWFDPTIHVVTGSDADSALTLIEVKEKPGKVPKAKAKGDPAMAGANAVEGAIPISPGQKSVVGGRGSVIKKTSTGTGRGGARPNAIRHRCRVDGKGDFGSVWQAWLEYKLDAAKCVPFRSAIKAAPDMKLVYEEGGKKYAFELFEPKK